MTYRISMNGKGLTIENREGEMVCAFFKDDREIAFFPLLHLLTFFRGRPWSLCYARVKDPEIVQDHGIFIQLPSDPYLAAYYGGRGTAAAALASLLYDLENGIIADAKIGPIRGSGRAMGSGRR
jgi:hypothetical protein